MSPILSGRARGRQIGTNLAKLRELSEACDLNLLLLCCEATVIKENISVDELVEISVAKMRDFEDNYILCSLSRAEPRSATS